MKLYDMVIRNVEFDRIREVSRLTKNIDEKSDTGWTALMYAIQKGNAAVVDVLIENGADVEMEDSKGITPLVLARRLGHRNIATLLQKAGATTKGRSK